MPTVLAADAPGFLRPETLAPIAIPTLLGLVAIYLLLPRAKSYPKRWGAIAGLLALVAAGGWLVWDKVATPETFLFYCFSALAIISGGLLVTQTNPVHAALAFALVVLSTCGLFLLLAAPFLMAATIIVYAGAIVVTFLFVIMLAQQEGLSDADHRAREPFLSAVAGFVLLGALIFVLNSSYDNRRLSALVERAAGAAEQETAPQIVAALGDEDQFFADFQGEAEAARGSPDRASLEGEVLDLRGSWEEWKRANNAAAMKDGLVRLAVEGGRIRDNYGALRPHEPTVRQLSTFSVPSASPDALPENVAPLGRTLFTDYLVAVELAGTLLLVATVGAIVISSRRTEGLR